MIRLLGELFLVIFLVLYGLGAVTNFRVVWMEPITGIAALLAGVLLGVSLAASNVRKGV